jgi:hypothetical protein
LQPYRKPDAKHAPVPAGEVNYVTGGAGAKDTLQPCARDSGDAWAWRRHFVTSYVFWLFAILFPLGSVQASNIYFVATTGTNRRACGTKVRPCQTIQYVNDHKPLRGGDTVLVLAGTYAGPLTTSKSGTSSAHLRYQAQNPGKAKIQCASGVPCSQVWRQNGNYVDLVGFEITSLNKTTMEGIAWTGSHGLIQGNKVHDIGCVGCASNGGDGIGTYSTAAYTLIDRNMVYNIALGTNQNTVHGIYPNATQYVTISNNLIFNIEVWGINFHHATRDSQGYHAIVVNNTIFNNAGGINMEAKASDYVANNIIVHNKRVIGNSIGTKQGLRECCHTLSGAVNIYTNNLLYDNNTDFYPIKNGAQTAVNANAITGKDPGLVHYTGDENGDYHLQSNSPARDAGTSHDVPNADYAGTERPQPAGGKYDIGAYEYDGAGSGSYFLMAQEARLKERRVTSQPRSSLPGELPLQIRACGKTASCDSRTSSTLYIPFVIAVCF